MTRSTIIVSPRERFNPLIPSLRSLFKTITEDVPVIVVDAGAPERICGELEALRDIRPFEWVHTDYYLTPHEARNIGFEKVETEFVVFVDNDIDYEPCWLDALENNAEKYKADVVAPLICIGPPVARTIHHAGGRLVTEDRNGCIQLKEVHRLMNKSIEYLTEDNAPVDNQAAEFHCFLTRSDCVRDMGGLDERLITREQMDFALRARLLNKRVTFEKDAVVTYMAKDPFKKDDLSYHLFRWSHDLAVQSVDAFCESWGVEIDRHRVLYSWISKHRLRAIEAAYPVMRKLLGPKLFKKTIASRLERKHTAQSFHRRMHQGNPKIPYTLVGTKRDAMIAQLPASKAVA